MCSQPASKLLHGSSQMSDLASGSKRGLMSGNCHRICFALMPILCASACRSFLIISMGVLFMRSGGTRWTKEFAISTVR